MPRSLGLKCRPARMGVIEAWMLKRVQHDEEEVELPLQPRLNLIMETADACLQRAEREMIDSAGR
jgi:hypothetical protein